MSQWDDVVPSQASTYQDDVNRQILELECENEILSRKVKSLVINRRTGKRTAKTLYQINIDRQQSCVARYWTRTPRSNSLGFEYRQVQNMHNVTQD